ncbi:hypothetical protein N0V94_004975 [Neodidymelliopsis sp. IMI 364377]|nr:hypothetical protein N0V94_004975 [Neodidymelliopsis sp. IMI 364377]
MTSNISTEVSPEVSATSPTDQQVQKAFSCVLCAQRKVKCDKKPGGCKNCTKARVPCIYKAPPPPRRRKKGARDLDTATKLRIYEDALRKVGIHPETLLKEDLQKSGKTAHSLAINGQGNVSRPGATHAESNPSEIGFLVTEHGKSRYLENGIWTSLRSEFRDLREILDETSDEESPDETICWAPEAFSSDGSRLLFGSPTSSVGLRPLHPQPVQAFKLWQCYLDNINPLVKVFHAPTVQQIVTEANGNLDQVPRNLSLQDIDARIIWMLAGMAQKIGQRIGLHRDGDMLKVPAFDGEIRRRLWWQIVMLEGFSQKLAGTGTGTNASALMGDVKMPANLNDSDLFPGMKELPKESDRATEMMFFLIRCHVGNFFKRFESPKIVFDGVWSKLTTSSIDIGTKEKAIKELEHTFEERFLRYCDPSIAWHLMCAHLAKAIIFMMRFMARGAEHQGKMETQADKDLLFTLSLQVCSSQNLAYTMREMQGFMWHVNMHFQWKAFVYVLSELRYRTAGPEVEQAWRDIQLTFDFHPSFDTDLSVKALPIAVSNLTMKAWNAYIEAQGMPANGEPYFIQLIRGRQHRSKKSSVTTEQSNIPASSVDTSSTPDPTQQSVTSDGMEVDQNLPPDWNIADFNASLGMPAMTLDLDPTNHQEEIDWSVWNDLFVDFKTNETNVYPPDLSTFDFTL